MRIVLASGNKGKIKEIKAYCDDSEVVAYSDLIAPFEIVEDGDTYQANALIKAQTIFDSLKEKEENFVVLSDDSGITVPALGNIPGIYSARYAGKGATDKENLYKLIDTLKEKGIHRTPAYYTAAMAIVTNQGAFTVHGWMHGEVIAEASGEGGFGYDPMFIPEGYSETLGDLDKEIKQTFSHRTKALRLAKLVLESL
ncbi:MAG: non-canonical purine NTP pyrophosphatase [Epsilonproteobacteria bacterium]|nr:non-canonical purine NTP pyrophosphatase [Campylobacterota bacterium]